MIDPATILADPRKKRFSREEYYKMVEIGLFDRQRVELIDGEVIQMAPQMNRRFVAIGLIERALRRVLGDDYWIRIQGPFRVDEHSEPEPDVAVVKGTPREYDDHPRRALIVVEVSDSSYRYDSKVKAGLYAKAGVEDYWILNLNANRLEIYREPMADDAHRFGHRYADVKLLAASDVVTCLAFPTAQIKVSDLLP